MNRQIDIFDGAASIDLPDGFETHDLLENEDVVKSLASVKNRIAASLMSRIYAPDTTKTHFVKDTMFLDKNGSHILGAVTGFTWGCAPLEDRLNQYYQIIARLLPMVSNGGTSIQRCEPNSEQLKPVGLLRYSFCTLEEDWLSFLLLFPIQGYEAVLSMNCGGKNMIPCGKKFMNLANSLTLN